MGINPGQYQRPKVVAHRGASSRAAEHTLQAYHEAIDLGVDAVECDVRLTADGHLVCVHDPRIDRTSDGTGRVSAKTLPELLGHDFASWWTTDRRAESGLPSDVVPDFDEDLNGILTLDRLLDLVTSSSRPMEILVETKHPTRYGGYVEQAVVHALERFGLIRKVGEDPRAKVMSFSSIAMRRMKELAPTVPAVYLMDKVARIYRTGLLPAGSSMVGPGLAVAREYAHVVEKWRANGFGLYIWTIDDRESLQEALALGADGIITNRPQDVLAWLAEGI